MSKEVTELDLKSFKADVEALNKKWGKNRLSNIIGTVRRLSFGSVSANYATFGGVPYQKLIVSSGVEHSGKTLGACQLMAQYQHENPGKVCVYVDAENTLRGQEEFLCKMTGLSTEEGKFLRGEVDGMSAEQIFDFIEDLQLKPWIGMIVLDSAPMLIPQEVLDSSSTVDKGMRASIAKALGVFIRKMTTLTARVGNILLVINQVRIEKLHNGAIRYNEPCGYALNYYPSFKMRFGTRKFINAKGEEISDSKATEAVGFRISFSTTKSRVGATNRGGGYITYLYDSGMDYLGDLVATATTFGYITAGGAWITLTDPLSGEVLTTKGGEPLKFNGKQKLITFLKEHPEFAEKYTERLEQAMSNNGNISLLADEDLSVILEQEQQVSNYDSEEEAEFKKEMEKLDKEEGKV
jgi:recA bacterial DNA recombination protein